MLDRSLGEPRSIGYSNDIKDKHIVRILLFILHLAKYYFVLFCLF